MKQMDRATLEMARIGYEAGESSRRESCQGEEDGEGGVEQAISGLVRQSATSLADWPVCVSMDSRMIRMIWCPFSEGCLLRPRPVV
jgi:hypothetical protein